MSVLVNRKVWIAVLFIAALLVAANLKWPESFTNYYGPQNFPGDGTVFYDRWRAEDGVNIVNTSFRQCRVLDMEGREIANLPGGFCMFLPGGEYFAISDKPRLFNSKFEIIWTYEGEHQSHEAKYDAKRDWIWMIVDSSLMLPKFGKLVIDKIIAVDRKTGREVFRWEPFEDKAKLEEISGVNLTPSRLKIYEKYIRTHFNSIDFLPSGEILLSDFGPSAAVFTLNIETKEISWHHIVRHGERESIGNHSPQYIEGGSVLYFVNEFRPKAGEIPYSFLEEVAMDTHKVIWSFEAKPREAFYTVRYGNVINLPNGNRLVTHLSNGKGGGAFEINRAGRLVWQWNNDARNEATGKRVDVYRVLRVPRAVIEPYLKAAANL